ncbi:restriction endonuclease subunit S, partial [bacterium]|nr:restriction endonuclease subunit S [bacterium]
KGYPLITSKNVINGSISFENVNLISQKDYDEINKRSKVEKGDLLMPMIGTIGRPTIVESEKKFAIKMFQLVFFLIVYNFYQFFQ